MQRASVGTGGVVERSLLLVLDGWLLSESKGDVLFTIMLVRRGQNESWIAEVVFASFYSYQSGQ